MLLSNAISIHINNKEAKEIWFGGSQIWTPAELEIKPLEEYTWEQIQNISKNGKASTYFKLGDKKTVTYNGEEFKVGIIHFGTNETYFMFTSEPETPYWKTTSTFTSYANSNVKDVLTLISKNVNEGNLDNLMKSKSVKYRSSSSASNPTITSTSGKMWIMSGWEFKSGLSGNSDQSFEFPFLYNESEELSNFLDTDSTNFWSRTTHGTNTHINMYWNGTYFDPLTGESNSSSKVNPILPVFCI